MTSDLPAAAGRSWDEADPLDLRLRRERDFLTGVSSVTSVDRVTSDVPRFEGSSELDAESLDLLRLGRVLGFTRGSGVLLSQASKRLPTGLAGGVSDAAGIINGVAASSSVLGYDLRLFLREGFWGFLRASSAVRSPWLRGRRRRLRSLSSSFRGEVILLSLGNETALFSYSTVTTRLGSSLSAVSDLWANLCGYFARSSADIDPRGEVRARRLLGRTLTSSVFSFSGFGDVDLGRDPSLFAPLSLFELFPLPPPLLVGRWSLPELGGFEGPRCLGGGLICPVLFPIYSAKGRRGLC